MSDPLLEVAIYAGSTLVMLGIAGAVHLGSAGKRRRGAEALQARWVEAATALGVDFYPSEPGGEGHPGQLVGTVEGHRLVVDVADGARGRITRFHVSFPAALPCELKVIMVAAASRARLRTGDARFDDCFEVEAPDGQAALRVLTAEVRDALVRLDGFRPSPTLDTVSLEVTRDGLTWCKLGLLSPKLGLVECARAVVEVAREVEVGAFEAAGPQASRS